MGPGVARPPNAFSCNGQPKICKSVTSFTHVHKTPIHSLSWQCCNKTPQCLISGCHNFHCNGKIIFNSFLPRTRGPLQAEARGLCPPRPTPLLRHRAAPVREMPTIARRRSAAKCQRATTSISPTYAGRIHLITPARRSLLAPVVYAATCTERG